MKDKVQFCKACQSRKFPPGYPGSLASDNLFLEECSYCGNKDLMTFNITPDDFYAIYDISSDPSFIQAMSDLHDKDIIEYNLKMTQFRNSPSQQASEEESNKPRCPKCGSTEIQIVPRKWTPLMGIMTNKTDRVCVNCKNKW